MVGAAILLLLLGEQGAAFAQDTPQAGLREFVPGIMNGPIALSPDRHALAFVTAPVVASKDRPVTVSVKLLETGEVVELSGRTDSTTQSAGRSSNLAWSPDGKYLAYVAPDEDNFHLRVWDRKSRSERIFGSRAACAGLVWECLSYQVQWSPDSKSVYFLAENALEAAAWTYTEQEGGLARARRQALLFQDPANGGVTVLSSPVDQDASAAGHGITERTEQLVDVAVADITTGHVISILEGTAARRLSLSPDGRMLLIASKLPAHRNVRQQYYDYYLIPAPPMDGQARPASSPEPALRGVRQWLGVAVWSPSGDRIAYAESGALTTGDVMVYGLESRKLRNLTASIPLPVTSTPVPPEARLFDYSFKFGAAPLGLVWSGDGRTLYGLRSDEIHGPRTQLWAISAATGKASPLAPDTGHISYVQVLNNKGVAVAGSARASIVASASFDEGDGDNRSGYVEVRPDAGDVTVLTKFEGNATLHPWALNLLHGAAASTTAFINERADEPPEVFTLDLRTREVEQITDVNGAVRRAGGVPERRLITWIGTDGKPRKSHLYLPPAEARPAGPLPVVMEVYPGQAFTEIDRNSYIGRSGSERLVPLGDLLNDGYAILTPDLAIKGDGETCNDIGINVVAVLDTAAATGAVDAARAAVMGHSFGGWTVNCIVTRTGRFKAGVSIAGLSDFVSLHFHPESSVYAAGGGQTNVDRPLWDALDLYWAESPVSGLRKVTTPLLLVHGKADVVAPFEQSVEMFVGLKRLGKTVTLVGYDGEGHTSLFSNPDYAPRIKNWIEHYLGPTSSSAQPTTDL